MVPVGLVCDLRDPRATPEAVGAKASNLAMAARVGLPTLPGLVLTTAAVGRGMNDDEVRGAVDEIFLRLGGGADRPLVVRSSSTIEDAGSSSMAGRFTSVLGVIDRAAFHNAVEAVMRSAEQVPDDAGRIRPLAVLVQPESTAVLGGVMFGVDPVTGDRGHIVAEVVAGSPEGLVSGRLVADHYVLTRRGRLVDGPPERSAPELGRGLRRRLARVARRGEQAFGGPQDIEWLVDPSGALIVLQARPVTAVGSPVGRTGRRAADRGVLLGPGPVAETFPDPLTTLEADLWVEPLAAGIRAAILTTRAASQRELERSPVVTAVDGWVAADLGLLGIIRGRPSFRRRVSPTAIGRRLAAAWHVGRARARFPDVASSVVATVDRHLAALGPLRSRSLAELGEMVVAARRELTTVHTHEVLAGMLLSTAPSSGVRTGSAAGAAVAALQAGRASGWTDQEIIARTPEVLMIVPPRTGGVVELSRVGARDLLDHTVPSSDRSSASPTTSPLDLLPPREALRLRARWLQELLGRLAGEIGVRLEAEGRVQDRRLLGHVHVEELVAMTGGAAAPTWLAALPLPAPGPTLPPSFPWSAGDGRSLRTEAVSSGASRERSGSVLAGAPAGGGRVAGVVVHDPVAVGDVRSPVLVVRHLDPRLAPLLTSLGALVAETGSPLSHLAILAREVELPTVVAVADAQRRLPVGVAVEVDGRTGEVRLLSAAGDDR